MKTEPQSSYNDVYTDPVFPFVRTLNSLGIPTNPDPVSEFTLLYNF